MSIPGLILLTVFFVLALCVAVCLFVRIRIEASFSQTRDAGYSCDMWVSLLDGKIRKRIRFNQKNKGTKNQKKNKSEANEKKLSAKDKLEKKKKIFHEIRYIYRKSGHWLRRSIFFEKIFLKISFGLEDACQTGIVTGILWGLIYDIVAVVSRFARISEPDISVIPVFDDEYVESFGECIVSFRPVNIMCMLLSVGINYYIINRKLSKKEKAAIHYGNSY